MEARRREDRPDRRHRELRHGARRPAPRGGLRRRDRLARRRAGAGARRPSSGSRARRTRTPPEAADLVVIATKADGAVETARSLREAIGTTPVLSVAAELSFTKDGVSPTAEATSIAQRIQDVVDGPVIAGLHSLAASNLGGEEAPDEDTLVCGDDADAKELVLELAGQAHVGPGDRRRPARERACARGDDGGDRQRQQALQGARRPARSPASTERGRPRCA